MRHGKKFNHLKRKKGHRTATLRALGTALITHKRIFTTLAKGRALRVFLEPIITKAKTNTMHSRRVSFRYLQDKAAITELYGPIAGKIGDRPGGYLRIIKTGFRKSDGAEMCLIEFVDFNDLLLAAKAEGSKKKRTRRGRRKSSGAGEVGAATATAAAAEEAVTKDEEE